MLLEREAELGALAKALAVAGTGRGALVVVSGGIGAGRSALLGVVPELARAGGLQVLRASGSPLERDLDFGVARQLLEPTLLAAPAATRNRWLAGPVETVGLALLGGLPLGGRAKALHGLRVIFERISAERPLTVVVDDLQWADDASLAWLRGLAADLARMPVLMVAAMLDGDPGGDRPVLRDLLFNRSLVLRPAALSAQGVRALARRLGGPAGDHAAGSVHRRSGGNPLLVTALLQDGAVPLRERLTAVLARLPGDVRETVRVWAALDPDLGADMAFAAELAGLDAVAARSALAAGRALGLLGRDGAATPLAEFLRELLAERLTASEAGRIGLRAAGLLYETGRPAGLAAAALRAVPAPPRQWATRVFLEAARDALARHDPRDALGQVRAALRAVEPRGRERASLLLELAAAERTLDPDAARRHVTQAASALEDVRDKAAALVRLPLPLTTRPVAVLAERWAAELAEKDSRTGRAAPDRRIGDLLARMEARTRFAACEDRSALVAAAERLRAMGPEPAMRTPAERELVAVLAYLSALGALLPAAELAPVVSRLLEHEPTGLAPAFGVPALALPVAAACEAVASADSWLSAPASGGSAQDRAFVLAERSRLALRTGRVSRAAELAQAAHALLVTPPAHRLVCPIVSWVALEFAEPQPAEAGFPGCAPGGAGDGLALHVAGQLRQAASAGQEELRAAFDDCGRRLAQAGWDNPVLVPWRTVAARFHHRLGDAETALGLIEDEYGHALRWGAPEGIGRSLRLKGRLLGRAERRRCLEEAVAVLESSANRLELGKALVDLGAARLRERLPGAAEPIRRGLLIAAQCEDNTLLGRARGLLDERSLPGWARLTDTQRRIAELAVAGRTNQEIAEELSVSRRVVEKHLTQCYRRLGIADRSQLADALRATGPDAP